MCSSDLDIPLAARIFSVVDVYDALRFDRPYRLGWEEARVRSYLKAEMGKAFDPAIVPVFFDLLDSEAPQALSA